VANPLVFASALPKKAMITMATINMLLNIMAVFARLLRVITSFDDKGKNRRNIMMNEGK
jgi:hypothetical protein